MDLTCVGRHTQRALCSTYYPLDGVIQAALAEERADAELEARLAAKRAKEEERAARQAALLAAEAAGLGFEGPEVQGEPGRTEHRRHYKMGGSRRRRSDKKTHADHSDHVESTKQLKPKEVVVNNVRTMSFSTSTALFNGRPEMDARRFPHGEDPSKLRMAMGGTLRTQKLNEELQAARKQKYESDLRAMADVEARCDAAKAVNGDGTRLRLGRLRSMTWQHSGFLFKRGLVFTWKWTKVFVVLCDRILYEFADGSLDANLVDAWPVLGATVQAMQASSRAHPSVLSFALNPYFTEDDPILSTIELSAPSSAERAQWFQELSNTSVCAPYPCPPIGPPHQHIHSPAPCPILMPLSAVPPPDVAAARVAPLSAHA